MEPGAEIFVQAIRIEFNRFLGKISVAMVYKPARTRTCPKSCLLSHFQVSLFPLRKASDEQRAEYAAAAEDVAWYLAAKTSASQTGANANTHGWVMVLL